MSGSGSLVATPASMRAVWAHRMLRQFSKPTCDKTLRINGTYCGCQLRTGRGLVLRLRKAADDQGRGVAAASIAPSDSAGTRPSGKSATGLGSSPALIRSNDSTDKLFWNLDRWCKPHSEISYMKPKNLCVKYTSESFAKTRRRSQGDRRWGEAARNWLLPLNPQTNRRSRKDDQGPHGGF